jgi:hypothetical protein
VSTQSSHSTSEGVLSRTRTTLMNTISSPIATFLHREPIPTDEKVDSEPPPRFSLINSTTRRTTAPDQELTSNAPAGIHNHATDNHEPDFPLSDKETISSSPRAVSPSFTPAQSPSLHVMDFGSSTSINQSGDRPIHNPKRRESSVYPHLLPYLAHPLVILILRRCSTHSSNHYHTQPCRKRFHV